MSENQRPFGAADLIALARLDIVGLRDLVFADPENPERVSFPHGGSPASQQVLRQIEHLEDVLAQLAAAPILGDSES